MKSPHPHPLGKVDTFHYDNGYVQIVSRQLCGVYLSIWVRRSMLPKVTGIQTTYVATGALGYLANKGNLQCCLAEIPYLGPGFIIQECKSNY